MSGVIFRETLRRHWRLILGWGLGLGLIGLYAVAIKGDVDLLQEYAELMKRLPPALLQVFGMTDVEAIATPDGFVAMAFYGYAQLVLAVFAVSAGLSITANEEDEGILDVVLSQPVPRWRVVAEKLAAYLVILVGIIVLSTVGLMIGNQMSGMAADAGRMVQSSINLFPVVALMMAMTAFLGTVLRRRSTALAVASTIIVASYFVEFLGDAASESAAAALSALSFFHYYDSQTTMLRGLDMGSVLLLLAVTAALAVGTVWAFERRDVGL